MASEWKRPTEILKNVLDAMQDAEEIYGVEGQDYLDLMRAIRTAAQERIDTFAHRYCETCFFCQAKWGECRCPQIGGFEFEGTWIASVNVDETERFFVNPETYYGEVYLKWKRENQRKECDETTDSEAARR